MSLPWEDEPDAWWAMDGADYTYHSRLLSDDFADVADKFYRVNPPSRYDTDVPVRYSMLDQLLMRARESGAK